LEVRIVEAEGGSTVHTTGVTGSLRRRGSRLHY
jgi:hypothetical protein